jgi:hypothetical protein
VVQADDDDRPGEAELPAEGARETGGGPVDRLSGGCAVLVQPGFPPGGDPDPLGAVGAEERPDRVHEPGAPAAGQVNCPGWSGDRDEQGLHPWLVSLASAGPGAAGAVIGVLLAVQSRGRGRAAPGERDDHAAAFAAGLGVAELLVFQGELVDGADEGGDVGPGLASSPFLASIVVIRRPSR